jgi:hypothetical protein
MTGAPAHQPSVQPRALPAVAEVMRPALSTAGPDDHLTAAPSGGHFPHPPAAGDAAAPGSPASQMPAALLDAATR